MSSRLTSAWNFYPRRPPTTAGPSATRPPGHGALRVATLWRDRYSAGHFHGLLRSLAARGLTMLTISGPPSRPGMSRRGWLRVGGLALGGLALPDILRAEARGGGRNPAK